MDEYELRKLTNRILSGYIFIKDYILDIPSVQMLAEADYVYESCLYENRFETMLRQEMSDFILMKNGLWSIAEQNQLDVLPKQIDHAKLMLYKNTMLPSRQKGIRKNLTALKNRYNLLMSKKSVFDEYTLEFLAEQERERFIFSKIVLNNEYKSVVLPPRLLDQLILVSKKYIISVKDYRELARDDRWQSMWSTAKSGLFRKIGEEQRYLISYTQMYENINKHPEAPNSQIIKDDDALDGWMIYMKNKQEQEKKEQDLNQTKNTDKGNEQFIMASSPEDVQEIWDMNDTRGKVIQTKIHKMVQKDGVVNEYNIQELRQDANVIKR